MPQSKKKNTSIGYKVVFVFKTVVIFFFFLSLPGVSVYQPPLIRSMPLNFDQVPTPALYPQSDKKIAPPNVSAEGVVVVDLPSQVVLYEKDAQKKLPPASTTKIVTALVALDYYKPGDVLEVKTPLITEERLMGLKLGEKITVENLLYGALVHSANDAPNVLAQNYPGGVNAFVEKMNEKVDQLGFKSTHFINPIGFEDENHYTTASDLSQISRIALTNDFIKKIIGTKEITVADESYTLFHKLENVNTLLGRVAGVAGVKTGWTQEAKEVLSTVVKRDGHEVLIVLLKSEDRFGETEKLIEWIFTNYKWVDLRPTETQIPR